MTAHDRAKRVCALVVSFIAWSALLLQLALTLDAVRSNGQGVAWALVIYLGYFTILSNLVAALTATLPLVAPHSRPGRFFARDTVITGVTAAIATVGLAYFVLLRHVWDPQGWQFVADVALHYVVPTVFVGYWWIAVRVDGVRWADMPFWAVFPLAYLVYALVRGGALGSYPYYFIDVAAIGYRQALLNSLGVLALFLAVSAALILIANVRLRLARQHA